MCVLLQKLGMMMMNISLFSNYVCYLLCMSIQNIVFLIVLLFVVVHLLFYFKTAKSIDIIECGIHQGKTYIEKLLRLKQPLHFKVGDSQNEKEKRMNSDEHVLVKTFGENGYKRIKHSDIEAYLRENKGSYSEHNHDFMAEKTNEQLVSILKPKLAVNGETDYIIIDKDSKYPIKRQFYDVSVFHVVSGNCNVTLFSPVNDFIPSVNPIMLEQTIKREKTSGTKRTEVQLETSDCLSVPPHWFVRLESSEPTRIIHYTFHTPFSVIGNLHYIVPHMLTIYNKDKT